MSLPECCPQCGGISAEDAPVGLCGLCALRGALELAAWDTQQPLLFPSEAGPTFGNYLLLEEIARGGMGVIHKARQTSLNRVVALKMILRGHLASVLDIQRFQAEAEAASSLQHPNIVSIHEAGEHCGQHYFSMDYVEGASLAELARERPLPSEQAARYVKIAAEAIQFAHERNILHRDLKPSNILIDRADQPRITDFGLAKRMNIAADLTMSGQILGTPNFIPPEQVTKTRTKIGPASDVYSLGAVLFYLLTSRPPFAATTLADTLEQVRYAAPPAPRLFNRAIPLDLETICLKCLEKEAPRRYQTARELAEDLGRFLDGHPIRAKPINPLGQFWRWSRRHPGVASLMVSLLLVFLAGLAGVTYAWRKAERNAREAVRQQHRVQEIAERLELERVAEFFARDQASAALAHLAGLMRLAPTNRIAAGRLLSALSYRSFALPLGPHEAHEGRISSAEFSPDGTRIISASLDHTARIWQAEPGHKSTARLLHRAAVTYAGFSADGRKALTASSDGTVRLWDAETGLPLGEPFWHPREALWARLSPNGFHIVTAGVDQTARLWDVKKSPATLFLLPHASRVTRAQFSSDGSRVLTASHDTARVWDVQTGQSSGPALRHDDRVADADFSADGRRIVTAGYDRTVRIWDSRTGQLLVPALRHADVLFSAQFSPDGARVVTASGDHTARVWDSYTGEPVTPPLKHSLPLRNARFSPDGRQIATISMDLSVRLWDAANGEASIEPLWHKPPLGDGNFSPDGRRLITSSGDLFPRIWDILPGNARPLSLTHSQAVRSAVFSSSGRFVVTASEDGTARVWETDTGQSVTGPLRHEGTVWCAEFSGDERRVITGSEDKTARIWDARTGAPITSPLSHGGSVLSVHFSPDGNSVLTISTNEARLWNAVTGHPRTEPLKHGPHIFAAIFTRNGQWIVTVSSDRSARIWEGATGKLWGERSVHSDPIETVQCSPDGEHVATAGADQTARIWSFAAGEEGEVILRHNGAITHLQFNRSGDRIATASNDKTARIWDSRTGRPMTQPLEHQARVNSVDFSPDGERLVTASADHTVRVWDVRTGQAQSEPLRHIGWVYSAWFSPDGSRILTASDQRAGLIWNMPEAPLPVPAWLSSLAEAVGGRRLNESGVLEQISSTNFFSLKKQLMANTGSDFYARWAQWFFADRSRRTISPWSAITVPNYVKERIEANSLRSLQEAVDLNPTNALAVARLARKTLESEGGATLRKRALADFYSRRASELAPNDSEVLRIRSEIADALKKSSE